jgi:hypothetical protein
MFYKCGFICSKINKYTYQDGLMLMHCYKLNLFVVLCGGREEVESPN